MAAAIPVDTKDICSITNLPADMAENPIWTEHSPLVMARLAEICVEASYTEACEDDPSDAVYYAYRTAFAFLALESAAEFLNLKTIGAGIIKSTGIEDNAAELLTGIEIDAFKAALEKRALNAIKAHLNTVGTDKLNELAPRPPRLMRVGVI